MIRNPKDSAELVYIQGGKFLMGDKDRENNPRRRVELTDYYICKNVVTVKQYLDYCKVTGTEMPPAPAFNPYWSKKDHPIVNVTWDEARAYAQWAGGDLPSEAQWERAARGTDGRRYPWGDTFDSSKCWCSKERGVGTTPVGRYGISPDGCTDMAGNVYQWCLDWCDHEFWRMKGSRVINPVNEEDPWGDEPGENFRAQRGGFWGINAPDFFSCGNRIGSCPPDARLEGTGFRVVLQAPRGKERFEVQERLQIIVPEMVAIPGGTFSMGSTEDYKSQPEYRVTIRRFSMSKNLVTVKQYMAYCSDTGHWMPPPPHFNQGWRKEDHPIVGVSWFDANWYCQWLSQKTGKTYDLPTEAEWEYAARGGKEGKKYPWGDDWDASKCNNSQKRRQEGYPNHGSGTSILGTSSVGSYPANGYGLNDMAGNVDQWCKDWYDDGYDRSDTDNPKGASSGRYRVLRGGSFIYVPGHYRCAKRGMDDPGLRENCNGFRIVHRGLSFEARERLQIVVPEMMAIPGGIRRQRPKPKDEAELVYIPAGKFLMGDDAMHGNPRHTVELTEYYIYKNLVTVEQYEAYCKATGTDMPPAPAFDPYWRKKDHPIVNVDWFEARVYAQWAGGDLPSEAQWERAARGTDGRRYPWGDTFDSSKCWCSKEGLGDSGGTTAVGKYGVSPEGCTDMAGNVWQWCLDWYDAKFWTSSESLVVNPVNETVTAERVLRGGSWYYVDADLFRCAKHVRYLPGSRYGGDGFRVVFQGLR